NRRAFLGPDSNQLLHFKVCDFAGRVLADKDETQLSGQDAAIASLKQQLSALSTSDVLTRAQKDQLLAEAMSLFGIALPAEPAPEREEMQGPGPVDGFTGTATLLNQFVVRVMPSGTPIAAWPTSGQNLIVVGIVNSGAVLSRILDAGGGLTGRYGAQQSGDVASLKQWLQAVPASELGLSPSEPLRLDLKVNILYYASIITGLALDSDSPSSAGAIAASFTNIESVIGGVSPLPVSNAPDPHPALGVAGP